MALTLEAKVRGPGGPYAGGGNGQGPNDGDQRTANYWIGGGGGDNNPTSQAGDGGSGIVVIRYPT